MPDFVIYYRHLIHPHTKDVLDGIAKPTTVNDHRLQGKTGFARFNAKVGLLITLGVGTMVCAYIFAIIALISLPSAIKSGNLTIIIAWVSSNFLQLVLLPVIIVGPEHPGRGERQACRGHLQGRRGRLARGGARSKSTSLSKTRPSPRS